MKFLTDENVAVSVVDNLRNEGFDVKDIEEEGMSGTSDDNVLELAEKEDRIIITHDKDFKDLFSEDRKPGVLLIRLADQRPSNVRKNVAAFLNSDKKQKLEGNLVVLSERRVVVHTA